MCEVMQKNITATVFGGSSDTPQYSAYPPYDDQENGPLIDDTIVGVALPSTGLSGRTITITNNANGKMASKVAIVDVGPHVTDDPYWKNGTRPWAESHTANRSGIDLTTELANLLGIAWGWQSCDDVTVNWIFDDEVAA